MVMMRLVLLALAFTLAALSTTASAEQPSRVHLIGVLFTNAPSNDRLGNALSEGLRELGYVEGSDFKIEYRSALGHLDRLPRLAEDLVHLRVEAMLVATEAALLAAKQATTTIPIVFQLTDYDPVASGLIDSLSRPGGNITGVFTRAPDLIGKRLELLKDVVPSLTHIAVFYDSYGERQVKDAQSASRALGIQLVLIELRPPYDYSMSFKMAKLKKAGAVLFLYSPHFYPVPDSLVRQAVENRLPIIGYASDFARAGFLLSYGVDGTRSFKRLAYFIDRVLKGAKPSELPVEQPSTFELVINLKIAKALNITIPESILLRADEVIR